MLTPQIQEQVDKIKGIAPEQKSFQLPKVGDFIRVSFQEGKRESNQRKEKVKVVHVGPKFIVVERGNYRESILLSDLINREL